MAGDVTPETIELSVNLEDQALNHIDFLARVDTVAQLKQYPGLRRALYRYERYWLPLAAEHSQECLSAPLDIEWAWHCHMLSPIDYGEDCIAIVDTIVNHRLCSLQEYDSALEKSRGYWHKKYGNGNDVPFQVDYQTPLHPSVPDNFQSKITYNIIEAVGRQKVFYYQVSLPHYRDRKYLRGSLHRYRQFLFLKTKYPHAFIVPCFEMDLMWHTHQVNPVLYRKDTTKLLGHVFNHDDSTNDRSEGSKQYVGQQETTQYWSELFEEPYSSPGAMYRGPSPGDVLHRLSVDETDGFSTKKAKVTLTRLKVMASESVNTCIDECKDVRVQCHGCAGNRNVIKWFSVKTKKVDKNEKDRSVSFDVNGESFIFDTRTMNSVKLILETNTGKLGCISRPKEYLGGAVYDFLTQVENPEKNNYGLFQATQSLGDGASVSLQCTFAEPVRGSTLLFLRTGTEEAAVISTNVQAFLGPVNFDRLHNGTSNHCQITTIGMNNHIGREDFTCKVVFSHSLALHVIQIFYRGHMVSLGHLIGCDQLPSPSQVEKDIMTLDHQEGERAVLIKNHAGDWGILKGRWMAEGKGLNGTSGKGSRFPQGKLSLCLYKMSTSTCERTLLDPSIGSFRLDSTKVDLQKGVIEADTGSLEVGERIALAFCVSLLQKMLVPRRKT